MYFCIGFNLKNANRWHRIMSYGPGVRLIYPRNVVAYMRDMLRRAADSYDEADIEESSEL